MRKISIFLIALLCAGNFTLSTAQIAVGDLAPNFTVNSPDDKKLNLYDLKGKTVILDFWASWCGPCRSANPDLIKIYNKYHALGLEVFSVSLDQKKEPWLKAIAKDKMIWPYHGSDLKGWEAMPAMLYGVQAVPTSILLDGDMKVLFRTHSMADLESKLKELYISRINVYPTISSKVLYFSEKIKYEILDSVGAVKLQGKDKMVDIASLSEGLYRVNFDGRSEYITKISADAEKSVAVILPNMTISFGKPTTSNLYMANGYKIGTYNDTKIDFSLFPSGKYWLGINGRVTEFEKR